MNELIEIKHLRKKLGMTQTELAQRAGVSQSLVTKIESGKIDPTYTKAKKLLETLYNIDQGNEICAKDIMKENIIHLTPSDTLKSAIGKMKKFGISQMPVIEGKAAVGTVSESILLDAILSEQDINTIDEVMANPPPTIPPDTSKEVIASLLKQFPLLLVKEKQRHKGIITKSDLIRAVYKKRLSNLD